MSLLYTLQGLDKHLYKPVIVLARPSDEVMELYQRAGFKTIEAPEIVFWNHTVASHHSWFNLFTYTNYWRLVSGWAKNRKKILSLVKELSPDIVHLNSMVLLPAAMVLKHENIPFVWHVREPPADRGWRTKLIGHLMRRVPELVFISDYDRQAWVGGKKGAVIHNYVDFSLFDAGLDGGPVRQSLGLGKRRRVILYLGRIDKAKGAFCLLEALVLLRRWREDFVCLMPGSLPAPPVSFKGKIGRKILALLGRKTPSQRFYKRAREAGIEKYLRPLPFEPRIHRLIAACDLLVFPSTVPHFARPVIEAAAMAKPAVGSDLGGVNELIEHERTGLLVKSNDPLALAEAIQRLFDNPEEARRLGQNALEMARERFSARKQIAKITEIYEKIAARRRDNPGLRNP